MRAQLNPYLNFKDQTREAMEFYRSVFGGELTISTFAEFGGDPSDGDKVMHSMLEAPNGIAFMAADTPGYLEYRPGQNAFSMSLTGDDEATLRGYFEQLSEGGTIGQPLTAAPWGAIFGSFTDRFGTPWLVNISPPGGVAAQ